MAFSLVGLARGWARGAGRVAVVCAAMLCVVAAGCSHGPTSPPTLGTVSGLVFVNYGVDSGGYGDVGVGVRSSDPLGLSSIAGTTAPDGSYSISNVPPGAGVVVLEEPATFTTDIGVCTAPAPAAYSGLTAGGTVIVNITVQCTPNPWDY
jgi:hypothetical protein